MTREEAIKELSVQYLGDSDRMREAKDMAISALSEELSEDGTLTVHVSDGSKVKRVFVMGDNIYGGLYYPDSAENKGEDRPKGHWIESGYVGNDNYLFECSECHHTDTQSKAVKVNYCWHCGADMRGDKAE